MRISKVTPLVLGTPWRNLTFLKVETDEGLVGVGEARVLNRTDAVLGYLSEAIPRYVLGSDPFQIERLVQRMFREDFGRAGEIIMTATALVEMACWDIIGKALDQPVYRLLGGEVREHIKAYANGWYNVERTPGEFHEAAKAVLDKGYRALKFDPFGAGFYELERAEKLRTIELVEAVRDAVGPDVEIMIEMHGRFNPVTAIELTRELARFIPAWVEEPVPPENIAALRKTSEAIAALGVPVATGERMHTMYEFRELFEMQAARHHPAGHLALWRHPEHEEAGRLGGSLLRACRAAQRRRAGLHGRGVTSGRLHHELQDSGAFQRFRRRLCACGCARSAKGGGRVFQLAAGTGTGRHSGRRRNRGQSPAEIALQPLR